MPRIDAQVYRPPVQINSPVQIFKKPAGEPDLTQEIERKAKKLNDDLKLIKTGEFDQNVFGRIVGDLLKLEEKVLKAEPPIADPRELKILRIEIAQAFADRVESLYQKIRDQGQSVKLLQEAQGLLKYFGDNLNTSGVTRLVEGLETMAKTQNVESLVAEFPRYFLAMTLIEIAMPIQETPLPQYVNLQNPELLKKLGQSTAGIFARSVDLQKALQFEKLHVDARSPGEKILHDCDMARVWNARMSFAIMQEKFTENTGIENVFPYPSEDCRIQTVAYFKRALDAAHPQFKGFVLRYTSELIPLIFRTQRFDLLPYAAGLLLGSNDPAAKKFLVDRLAFLEKGRGEFSDPKNPYGLLALNALDLTQALVACSDGKPATFITPDVVARVAKFLAQGQALGASRELALGFMSVVQALERMGKSDESKKLLSETVALFTEAQKKWVEGKDAVSQVALPIEVQLGFNRTQVEFGMVPAFDLKSTAIASALSDQKIRFMDLKGSIMANHLLILKGEITGYEEMERKDLADPLRNRALGQLKEIIDILAKRPLDHRNRLDLGYALQLAGVFSSNLAEKRQNFQQALKQFSDIQADNKDQTVSPEERQFVAKQLNRLKVDLGEK